MPSCLCRPFQSVQFFIFCLAMVQLGHFLTGSYLRACLSTIERLYRYNSKHTGMLVSAVDIGTLGVIVFVSYLGRKVHRPRTVAIATIIMSLAALLFGMVYFAATPSLEAVKLANDRSGAHVNLDNSQNRTMGKLCELHLYNESDIDEKNHDSEGNGGFVYAWMFAAMVVFGVGIAPVNPLGVSYLDDAADPNRAPLYVALLFALSIIGPAFGHLIAAKTLTITSETKGPAWNIGFFIGATIMVLAQIPLWFFPRVMPKQKMVKEKRLVMRELKQSVNGVANEAFEKEVGGRQGGGVGGGDDGDGGSGGENPKLNNYKLTTETTSQNEGENDDDVGEDLLKMGFVGYVKGFFKAAKEIVQEPIWCLMTAMTCMITAMISGVISFQSKYLEIQFGTSAGKANLLLGTVNIPVGIIGIVLGGFIMKKRAYTLNQAARHCLFFFSVAASISIITLFIGCETRDIVGINKLHYKSSKMEIETQCNQKCQCRVEDYSPICTEDGVEFLSPCHAGCKTLNITSNMLGDCSCAPGVKAHVKKCDHKCKDYITYYVISNSVAFLISGLVHSPGYIIFLRSVKPKHKSLAIGLQYLFVRAIGKFPSPIYFGAIVDSACLLWSNRMGKGRGGSKGSCLIYDSDSLRIRFWGVALLIKGIIILIYLAVTFILWRRESGSRKNAKKEEGTH